jgi:hypothetical protein
MLTRAATVTLFITLCLVGGTSSHSKPKKVTATPPAQDPPLVLSTTTASQPSGGTVFNLTGRYQSAGKAVNLRATTIKSGLNIRPTGPPNQSPSAPEPPGNEPDSYYSNSDMTKSDGTVMVQTTNELDQTAARDVLYFTIGGVTITFDLNTQQASPLSDADQQQLEAWVRAKMHLFVVTR